MCVGRFHIFNISLFVVQRESIGGRNGYGSKLCNIYSDEFPIKIKDPVNNNHYIAVVVAAFNFLSAASEPKKSANASDVGAP